MRVPSELFSVRAGDSNGCAHLRLTGRFDSAAIPALDLAIGDVHGRDVTLDLRGITFMDGAAWLAVMACEHRVQDWGNSFRLENAHGRIRKIFELTETEYLLSEVVSR
ncbi:MAG: STAS domain-containing protein [Actinomycetota bacterium]